MMKKLLLLRIHEVDRCVQNVNGNILDTTNSINLSTHKKDTTMNSKDSLK